MKKNFKYIISREGKYYVANCLNVEVSSFGESIDQALTNLEEALELYYDDREDYKEPGMTMVGDLLLDI